MKKLTEFVTECKNEQALNSFFKELLRVDRIELGSSEQIVVTMDGNRKDYSPDELVAYMLDHVEDQGLIRKTVSHVKENFDYKKA
ncbi:hypothetical protein [Haloplasma contractile]|uniref:hypothetical protein n=1 Tax=Haloplasma contractile TaxID=471825 RepID=UPI001376AC9E|nr:hypothetical protein [Haloplasma contractile]